MKDFPLYGENAFPNSPFKKIIENGMGIPVNLDSAPTTSGGELANHGDNGFFGGKWYVNFFGSTYSFTGTLV